MIGKLYAALLQTLRQDRPAALLRLIASSGSSPRGTGASMLLRSDGTSLGSIGGGEAEFRALERAKAHLENCSGESLHFSLYPGGPRELGMICGGSVTVSITCFSPKDEKALRLLEGLETAIKNEEEVYLLTRFENGVAADMGLYTKKEGLQFCDSIPPEALFPLPEKQPVLREKPVQLFIEPFLPEATLYIFGGGHISRELVPLLARLDFQVKVVEDRADFAEPARFPGALESILWDFSDFESRIRLKERDYVLIMTRGHVSDYEILRKALSYPLRYVGMIGSRKKRAVTYEKLRSEGFSESDIGRIHSPIGLAIGAETPEEIAVSIAAELIAVRAGKNQ